MTTSVYDTIIAKYGTLWSVVASPAIAADLKKAIDYFVGVPKARPEDLAAYLNVDHSELIYYLCSDNCTRWPNGVAGRINFELSTLASGTSIESVRRAFADKLLNDAQWKDVNYEIVASCAVLRIADPRTLQFEKTIPGRNSNSDIFACVGGSPFRVECMAIHFDWDRYTIDKTLSDIICSAGVAHGFYLRLGRHIYTTEEAEAIKAVIEKVHLSWITQGMLPRDQIIDCGNGIVVRSSSTEYHCDDSACPIDSLAFHDPADDRTVTYGAIVMPMTSESLVHELGMTEQNGLVMTQYTDRNGEKLTAVSATGRSARNDQTVKQPTSRRIADRLAEKAANQTEPGIPNYIVIGITEVFMANDVTNALCGVPLICVDPSTSAISTERVGSKPFLAHTGTESGDVLETVSGVWLMRIGECRPISRFICRAGAAHSLPESVLVQLADAGEELCRQSI